MGSFITGKTDLGWGAIAYYVKTDEEAELLKRIVEALKPDRIFVRLVKDNRIIMQLISLPNEEVEITINRDFKKIIEAIIPEFDDEEVDEYSKWGE